MSGNTVRWLIVIGALLAGLFALVPTFMDASDGSLDNKIPQEMAEGSAAAFVLDRVEPLTLGLDLQGGLLLQYNVLVDEAIQDKLDQLAKDLESQLRQKDKALGVQIRHERDTDQITVVFEDPAQGKLLSDDFMQAFPNLERSELTEGSYELRMRPQNIDEIKSNAVLQAVETIRQRVDGLGVAEPSIARRGVSDIVVQMPGLEEKDSARVKKLIGQTAQLKFRMVDDAGTNNFFGQFRGQLPKGFQLRRTGGNSLTVTHKDKRALEIFLAPKLDDDHVLGYELYPIYKDAERKELDSERSYWKTYYIFRDVKLKGEHVKDARVAIDQQFNKPYTAITFDAEGAKLFGDLSEANVGKRMAIMLDDVVKSAPAFEEAIRGGSARITMGTMASNAEIQRDAQDLVIVLDGGALQAPLEKQFETSVGPSLGQDSINSSMRALLVGSLLVILFMAIYYRGAGVISVIALIFNIVFIFAALAMLGATLTLPGIAGIVLTVGMAVDANVIIFERVREELEAGTRAREAVATGYGKALSAVMDANITTGIAGLVLLQFGTGPIKGFAVTLLIGILGTIFTAIFVSRLIFDLWLTGDRATRTKMSI